MEERYYIGSMSRLDLQQAQVDFNSDSSKVLNQLEVVHTSRIRLNELMALNNVEEEIQIKDSLIYPNPFLDEVDLWKNTLEANASLLIAQRTRRCLSLIIKGKKPLLSLCQAKRRLRLHGKLDGSGQLRPPTTAGA